MRPTIRFDIDSGEISIGTEPAHFETYFGNEIFRPRSSTEKEILSQEAQYVLAKHQPGQYSDSKEINTILQTIFGFHKAKLDEALSELSTRDYLCFLLWQYDLSHETLIAGRAGKLSESEWNEWEKDGPIFRRALKYLIERVCSFRLQSTQIEDQEQLLKAIEIAQVTAEEFVRASILSESTFAIFPNETILLLSSKGPDLFRMEVTNERFSSLGARSALDGKNRDKFLVGAGRFTLDRDKDAQDKYIGMSFKEVHGLRYSEAIELLDSLSTLEAESNHNPFNSCYFHKREIVSAFSETLKLPPNTVECILSGFTITPDLIVEKAGGVWNPKRSYGAIRKGIFEVPHRDGSCLAWSRRMARETLEALIQAVVFHKFPSEWMSANIKPALDELDNHRGKWFESVVAQNLSELGFLGKSRKDKIGDLRIPKDVGEIDFLGFSHAENKVIIIECKMTQYSSEPRLWRGDLDKYVYDKRNYAKKFRKKRDWVISNLTGICETLSIETGITIKPTTVSSAMLTYSPNIASCFIDDFPCVSLTELMIATEKAKE